MPRYFFKLISANHKVDDPDGQELDDLNMAMDVAEMSLCEIAGETLKVGADVQLEAISITDETGMILARVTTGEAVLPRFTSFEKSRSR